MLENAKRIIVQINGIRHDFILFVHHPTIGLAIICVKGLTANTIP